VVVERWLAARAQVFRRVGQTVVAIGLALAWTIGGALSLPIAPVESGVWNVTSKVNDNFAEEIGWPELVATVASIYAQRPAGSTGILAANYGEAGALDLYGPAYGLPPAISGADSYWYRGYPEPPPEALIVVGYSPEQLAWLFTTCEPVAQVANQYGVKNEETSHPGIFVCRDPRQSWPELWHMLRQFQ
jgi:hypothetical protein